MLLASFLMISCGKEEEKPEEESTMEEVIQDTKEKADEIKEEVQEEAEEITEEIKEEVKEVKEKVKETFSAKNEYKGQVVSLTDFIRGENNPVDANRIKELSAAGQIVGLVSNGTFYIIYDTGANYGGRLLTKYATGNEITVEGKVRKVGGINFLQANTIK